MFVSNIWSETAPTSISVNLALKKMIMVMRKQNLVHFQFTLVHYSQGPQQPELLPFKVVRTSNWASFWGFRPLEMRSRWFNSKNIMSLWQMFYLQPVTQIIISEHSVWSDLFLPILMQLAEIFEVVTKVSFQWCSNRRVSRHYHWPAYMYCQPWLHIPFPRYLVWFLI